MNQSFTLSNSPSPVKKLSGNAQQAFDLAGDLYSLTQQWNLLNSSGCNIISKISETQVKNWDKPATHFVKGSSSDELLEPQCDQLLSIISEMERIVKQMGKIRDQYTAVGKLEGYQQPSSDEGQLPHLMFLTWPALRFEKVVADIKNAYEDELKVKKCIGENVAYCSDRETLNFHKISWVYQVNLTPTVKLQLESLLAETGQR